MTYQFIIPGALPSLNEYINAERTNRFMAAKIKKESTYLCYLIAKLEGWKTKDKVHVIIEWHCKNEKIDPDNLAFAKKFILDGLVKAGVLENDGWKQIEGFQDSFYIDAKKPRIVITLVTPLLK